MSALGLYFVVSPFNSAFRSLTRQAKRPFMWNGRMGHSFSLELDEIRHAELYIYRMLEHERATIAITRKGDQLKLSGLWLKDFGRPDKSTVQVVQDWFKSNVEAIDK